MVSRDAFLRCFTSPTEIESGKICPPHSDAGLIPWLEIFLAETSAYFTPTYQRSCVTSPNKKALWQSARSTVACESVHFVSQIPSVRWGCSQALRSLRTHTSVTHAHLCSRGLAYAGVTPHAYLPHTHAHLCSRGLAYAGITPHAYLPHTDAHFCSRGLAYAGVVLLLVGLLVLTIGIFFCVLLYCIYRRINGPQRSAVSPATRMRSDVARVRSSEFQHNVS